MKQSAFSGAVLAISMCLHTLPAGATTIGFAAAQTGYYIHDYQGFIFSGGWGTSSWVNNTRNHVYTPRLIPAAPLGAAWNNGGTNLSMQLATEGTFTLNSIDLYADERWGGQNPTAVTMQGWVGEALLYTYTTPILDTLNRGTFTTFDLNWVGIDTLRMSENPYANFLVTNIVVNNAVPNNPVPNNAVPEPTTILIFSLGLMGLAASRLKLSKRQEA